MMNICGYEVDVFCVMENIISKERTGKFSDIIELNKYRRHLSHPNLYVGKWIATIPSEGNLEVAIGDSRGEVIKLSRAYLNVLRTAK